MSSKDFSLIVSIPGKKPARHDLKGDTIAVGRGPDNDIQLLVAEVSVKHGHFQMGEETCKFIDNGSTNGTKINGKPVDLAGHSVEHGDIVIFGETITTYFVSSDSFDAKSIDELVAELEAAKPADDTAPVAVAIPAGPRPGSAPTPAKPGGAPVPAKPVGAPVPARPAGAPVPASPGAPRPVAPVPLKPAGAPVPLKPAAAAPGAPRPMAPAAAPTKPLAKPPVAGGAPVAPVPVKPAVPLPVRKADG